MRTELGHASIRNLRAEAWVWRLELLGLFLIGGAVFALVRGLSEGLAGVLAALLLLMGTPLVLAARQGRSMVGAPPRGEQGRVTIDGDVLEVQRSGEALRVPRADVTSGWIEPGLHGDDGAIVLLTRGGLELRAAIRGPGEGQALLRAAGVAPEQRAVKIRARPGDEGIIRIAVLACITLLSPLLAFCVAFIGMALFGSLDAGERVAMVMAGLLGSLVFGASIGLLLQRLAATTVTIGTDGVVVEQLRRRTLVPRAALARVQALESVVLLYRARAAPVRIFSSPEAAATVAARIQAALEVTQESPLAPLTKLDRRDRTIAEWLGELRSLARDVRGYRDASLAREDLFAVVKDGAAPAERRLAAAAALSTRRDDDTRAALRIAADTCADDRMRVVLDRAAEAELGEEEMEEAVTKLQVR